MKDSVLISCFVIGPIGDRLAEYGTVSRQVYEDAIQVWEKIVLPACNALDIKPLRADHISRSGEIVEQVCRHLREDDLVIADLTGANSNVMYELGLRHTVNKLTIQIGERGRLPFDISAIRTIQFVRSEAGFIDARNALVTAIQVGLSEGTDLVTATRVWNQPSIGDFSAEEIGPVRDVIETEDDEPGFLEKLADSETGMELMRPILESMTVTIRIIGEIATSAAEEMGRSDARGAGASAKLAIADRAAEKLHEQGSTLEAQVQEFKICMQRIESGVSYILERLESEPERLQEAQAFSQDIKRLAVVTEENEPIMQKFIESAMEAGAASRSLRKAGRRIKQAVLGYIESASIFKDFRDRLEKIES